MLSGADLKGLRSFVDFQKIILRRNSILTGSYANVGSNTVLNVWKCSDEYIYTDPIGDNGLEDSAIVAKWYFTDAGCKMISCNPYYPGNNQCTKEDEPFSYNVAGGSQINACQPACNQNITGGLFGLFTVPIPLSNKCGLYDPLLLAYYTDPYRRRIDEEEDNVEQDNRLQVRFESINLNFEKLSDPFNYSYVAKILPNYCSQYGLKYSEESEFEYNYNRRLRTCESSSNVISVITGNTILQGLNIGLDKVETALSNRRFNITKRERVTETYLASNDIWSNSGTKGKVELPFPLKLESLGIVKGTATEWLMWTDEYSYLDDGRNDMYGGRLIERDQSVERPFSQQQQQQQRDQRSTTKKSRITRQTGDVNGGNASNIDPLTKLKMQVKYFSIIAEKERRQGTVQTGEIVEQINYDLTLQAAASLSSGKTVSTILKIYHDEGLPVRMLSLATATASVHTVAEQSYITAISKLARSAIGRLSAIANVLNIVSLVGALVDLFSVFIYNPLSKYEKFLNDRMLLGLAESELVFNQKKLGTRRYFIEPSKMVISNSHFMDQEVDNLHDLLLSIDYMKNRKINSEGSKLDWNIDGSFYQNDTDSDIVNYRAEDGSIDNLPLDNFSRAIFTSVNRVDTDESINLNLRNDFLTVLSVRWKVTFLLFIFMFTTIMFFNSWSSSSIPLFKVLFLPYFTIVFSSMLLVAAT